MANIVQITDFDAPELDVYARITENQLLNRANPKEGIFIAESPLVIGRALDAGYVPVSLLLEKRHIDAQARDIVLRVGEIPIYTAEFDVLKQLTGFPLTRGALCAMRRPENKTVEQVCEGAKRVAVLEDVVNPTNVGAIIRSAAALGMDAVLLTPSSSNPLYRRAIRVSMGTVFQVPWTFLEQGIEEVKALGFTTAAMALSDRAIRLDDPCLKEAKRLAIVLGTEGDGLSDKTMKACDYVVKIPMANGVDSLNVAAASAVAFWQLGYHF